MIMKLWLSVALLSLTVAVMGNSDDQHVLQESPQTYPGFDLDLNALRWVQLEGQDPVRMTELEKVGSLLPLFVVHYTRVARRRSTSRLQESSSSICKSAARGAM